MVYFKAKRFYNKEIDNVPGVLNKIIKNLKLIKIESSSMS